jgi:hypothetical protein
MRSSIQPVNLCDIQPLFGEAKLVAPNGVIARSGWSGACLIRPGTADGSQTCRSRIGPPISSS